MSTKPRRSSVDRAFSVLRKADDRKADAVFVCRMFRREDGSWETDGSFQHWIRGLQCDPGALPQGVPGALIAAVTKRPIQKQVGKMLKVAAAAALSPHVGDGGVAILGDIIDTFTTHKD